MKQNQSDLPPIDQRLALLKRGFLWGFPLLMWGMILQFALTSSSPESTRAPTGAPQRDLSLGLEKKDCSFIKWKGRDFSGQLHPEMEMKVSSAMTHFHDRKNWEEKVRDARAIFRFKKFAPKQLLVNCNQASYGFTSRCIKAHHSEWWLMPVESQGLLQKLPHEELAFHNTGFGSCRQLTMQLGHVPPRFEAHGLIASVSSGQLKGGGR